MEFALFAFLFTFFKVMRSFFSQNSFEGSDPYFAPLNVSVAYMDGGNYFNVYFL